MKIGQIEKLSTSGSIIFYADELIVPEAYEALIFNDKSDCRKKMGGKKALKLFEIQAVKSLIFENNAVTIQLFNNREWTEKLEERIKNIIENFHNEK